MNAPKLRTFSDFQKQITVIEWWCGKDGIEIHYDFDGKELSLIATPEQACNILEGIGAIEGHGFENDTHFVRVEIELQGTAAKSVWIEWDQFILSYSFSQLDAINCAAWHEGEKFYQSFKNAA